MNSEYIWIIAVVVLIVIVLKFGKSQPSLVDVTENDIIEAIKNKQKVTAIKYYRSLHGVGLKEAKDAVENIASKL